MPSLPEMKSPDGSVIVKWDDTHMKSSYANVAHVTTSREEAVLLFGVNQTWIKGPEVTIQLTDRIILSPFAAKRLLQMLATALKDHENRYGVLSLETPATNEPQATQ